MHRRLGEQPALEHLQRAVAAVAERDGPFGDYSQGRLEEQPRKRSRLRRTAR